MSDALSTFGGPSRCAGGRSLVVFPGALGDFLLLAPALAALQATGFALELSVRRVLAELAQAMFPGPIGPPADGAAVSSLFTDELDPVLASWLRGSTRLDVWLGAVAGLERHARALAITRAHRHRVERGDVGIHAGAAYAAALGVRPATPRIAPAWIDVTPRSRALIIHPGAGAVVKRWSAGGFQHVADAWRGRGGETIIVLGPAEVGEESRWRAAGHRIEVGLALRDVVALLASARWYLGNDSGMSHLAGLLGCRGVVLFGPTSVARWRPLGGDLQPIVFAGVAEDEIAARVLARLDASVGSS